MRYSPATGCFYPENTNYNNLPDDIIIVSDDDVTNALSRPAGHSIAIEVGKLVIVPPAPLGDNELAAQVRAERDMLIAETDYLLMPDYPIDASKLAAMKVYRQALRDITIQTGFPQAINWPVKA